MAGKAGKTTDVTGELKPHQIKRPQPHGGALNGGGTPGNKGGPGRPPNKVRAIWEHDLAEVAHVPWSIASSTRETSAQRLAAVELLAKHTLPHQTEDVTTRTLEERKAAILAMLKRA